MIISVAATEEATQAVSRVHWAQAQRKGSGSSWQTFYLQPQRPRVPGPMVSPTSAWTMGSKSSKIIQLREDTLGYQNIGQRLHGKESFGLHSEKTITGAQGAKCLSAEQTLPELEVTGAVQAGSWNLLGALSITLIHHPSVNV